MPGSNSLWLRLDGQPLEGVVSYGEIAFSTVWGPDGCGLHEVTWEAETDHRFRHPSFRGDALVELFNGAYRIGQALLHEPDVASGSFIAEGAYRQPEHFLCLDSAGNSTAQLDEAIDEANGRGCLLSRSASLSSDDFAAAVTSINRLSALLNGVAEEEGLRWHVDPDAIVRLLPDPTTPTLHIGADLTDLGSTQSGYFSDVYGRVDLGSGLVTRHREDVAARGSFGRHEEPEDLSELGEITSTRANKILDGYLRDHSRPAPTNAIELTADQLTTEGGVEVDLAMVAAGEMARSHGFYDDIRLLDGSTFLDWTVGRTDYKAGADTIVLTPLNIDPSSFVNYLARLGSTRKRFRA